MTSPEPSGHVIVYGVRGVGLRTVEQLHAAGVAVVVVEAGPDDADPVAEGLLDAWEVPRHGGRTREALAAAGLDRTAAVVCVPDDELRAMQVALLVRRTRPDVRLVVRMDNTAVGRALAQVTGPGSVLDVAALAALPVVEACLGRRPTPSPWPGGRSRPPSSSPTATRRCASSTASSRRSRWPAAAPRP